MVCAPAVWDAGGTGAVRAKRAAKPAGAVSNPLNSLTRGSTPHALGGRGVRGGSPSSRGRGPSPARGRSVSAGSRDMSPMSTRSTTPGRRSPGTPRARGRHATSPGSLAERSTVRSRSNESAGRARRRSTSGAHTWSLNNLDLTDVREVERSDPAVEHLFLRENNFKDFDPYLPLTHLKTLDLSVNRLTNLQFLWEAQPEKTTTTGAKVAIGPPLLRLPRLRHLYLTGNEIRTLDGLGVIPELETLTLSNNLLSTFRGLRTHKHLHVLSCGHNLIRNFEGFPQLPGLRSVHLVGNPVASHPCYRVLLVMLAPTLERVDNELVRAFERVEAARGNAKIRTALRDGWLPPMHPQPRSDGSHAQMGPGTVDLPSWHEETETFLFTRQRDEAAEGKTLQVACLHTTATLDGLAEALHAQYHGREQIEGLYGGEEGMPLQLQVCLVDTRPRAQARQDLFFSHSLVPVEFRIQTGRRRRASSAFLICNLNNYERIPMRPDDTEFGSFFVTVYTSPGTCLYKYIVDGKEVVDEPVTITDEGYEFTQLHIAAPATLEDDEYRTSVLHVRWLVSNDAQARPGTQLFTPLLDGGATASCEFTPSAETVGRCIRAEVLAYMHGRLESCFYHITKPVAPSPPQLTDLHILGDPVEGEVLMLRRTYAGGEEGASKITWTRLTEGGLIETLELADETNDMYVLTDEDVGCTVYVSYTPVRADGLVGPAKEAHTAQIAPLPPRFKNVRLHGDAVEGGVVRVAAVYTGGRPGTHRYEWRNCTTEEDLTPGTLPQEYQLTSADVGCEVQCTAVPVSAAGTEGDGVVVKTPQVRPGMPSLTQIRLEGAAEEGGALRLVYEYQGGEEGATRVDWAPAKARAKGARSGGSSSGRRRAPQAPGADADAPRTYPLGVVHIGKIVTAKVTPIRSDGTAGQDYFVSSDRVRAMAPTATISVTGQPVVGQHLAVEAKYKGGTEGPSAVVWGRVSERTGQYVWDAPQPQQGGGGPRVRVLQDGDAGNVLAVKYTPIRSDGQRGLPVVAVLDKPVQRLGPEPMSIEGAQAIKDLPDLAIEFPEMLCEFDMLMAHDMLDHPAELVHRTTTYQWSRVRDPPLTTVPLSTAPFYRLCRDDVGCRISLSVRVPEVSLFAQSVSTTVVPALHDFSIDVTGLQCARIRYDGSKLDRGVLVGARLAASFDSLEIDAEGVDVAHIWEVFKDGRWKTVARTAHYVPTMDDIDCPIRLAAQPHVHVAGTPAPQRGTKVIHEFGIVRGSVDDLTPPRPKWNDGTSSVRDASTSSRRGKVPRRSGSQKGGARKEAVKGEGRKSASRRSGSSRPAWRAPETPEDEPLPKEPKKVYPDYLTDVLRENRSRSQGRRSRSAPGTPANEREDPAAWSRPWRSNMRSGSRSRSTARQANPTPAKPTPARTASRRSLSERGRGRPTERDTTDVGVADLTLPKTSSFASPSRILRFDSMRPQRLSIAMPEEGRDPPPGETQAPPRPRSSLRQKHSSVGPKSPKTPRTPRSPTRTFSGRRPPQPARSSSNRRAPPEGPTSPHTPGRALSRGGSRRSLSRGRGSSKKLEAPKRHMPPTTPRESDTECDDAAPPNHVPPQPTWVTNPVAPPLPQLVTLEAPPADGVARFAKVEEMDARNVGTADGEEDKQPWLRMRESLLRHVRQSAQVRGTKKKVAMQGLFAKKVRQVSPSAAEKDGINIGLGDEGGQLTDLGSVVAELLRRKRAEREREAQEAEAGAAVGEDAKAETKEVEVPPKTPESLDSRVTPVDPALAPKNPPTFHISHVDDTQLIDVASEGTSSPAGSPHGPGGKKHMAPASDGEDGAVTSPTSPPVRQRRRTTFAKKNLAYGTGTAQPETTDGDDNNDNNAKAPAAAPADATPPPPPAAEKERGEETGGAETPKAATAAAAAAGPATGKNKAKTPPRQNRVRGATLPGRGAKRTQEGLPAKPRLDYTPAHGKHVPHFRSLSFPAGAETGMGMPTAVVTHYKGGGVEGKSEMFWQRRFVGDDEWEDYFTRTPYAITATADDLHCEFRVCGIPRSAAGVRGPYRYSDAVRVVLGKNLAEDVMQALIRNPSFIASVTTPSGDTHPDAVVSLSEKKLKLRPSIDAPEPFAECVMDELHLAGVELPYKNGAALASTAFVITMENEDGVTNRYEVTLPPPSGPLERDFTALLIRVWAALSDYDTCMEYLGGALAKQWRDGLLDIPDRSKRDDLCRRSFEQRARPELPRAPTSTKGENVRALAALCYDKGVVSVTA